MFLGIFISTNPCLAQADRSELSEHHHAASQQFFAFLSDTTSANKLEHMLNFINSLPEFFPAYIFLYESFTSQNSVAASDSFFTRLSVENPDKLNYGWVLSQIKIAQKRKAEAANILKTGIKKNREMPAKVV
ncbi:MAG: hypothetical protein DWQ10_06630, partial [Calditrichaeota bacterium]